LICIQVDKNSLWLKKTQRFELYSTRAVSRSKTAESFFTLGAANSRCSKSEILPERVLMSQYATTDGTWPGAAGVHAIENLIRLDAVPTMPGDVSSDADYLAIARRSLAASGRAMQEDPVAHASMLVALERLLRMN
jgi:uncharacterized protein YyaL (SSP411 family)